jgi:hypothetical protein
MKIDRLETHDRLEHLKKQSFNIEDCCQNLIDQKPFGNHPFYIFAHPRTDDDGVSKRLIWQPRLTKPRAQTNSMLFKAYPGTDNIRICWMIPAVELWDQYKQGNVTEDEITSWSIHQYKTNRNQLETREEDDLSDAQIDSIYREIKTEAQWKKSGLIRPLISI